MSTYLSLGGVTGSVVNLPTVIAKLVPAEAGSRNPMDHLCLIQERLIHRIPGQARNDDAGYKRWA